MDDKDVDKVKNKLVLQSVENIILRIQDNFFKTFDSKIHRDYAIEKFETFAENFNISINESERRRLSLMKLQMYDEVSKNMLKKACELETQKPLNNVIDIKSRIKKPKL